MLKFLLIFFIVIYLIGYLGKFFLARWIKKMSGQNMNQNHYQEKQEGEVTINTDPTKNKKGKFTDGDYVDYEEIKE